MKKVRDLALCRKNIPGRRTASTKDWGQEHVKRVSGTGRSPVWLEHHEQGHRRFYERRGET